MTSYPTDPIKVAEHIEASGGDILLTEALNAAAVLRRVAEERDQARRERDEARSYAEDLGWMGDRCPSCGHRFRFRASGCPQCRKPIPAPWKYPSEMPDKCDCERCIAARSGTGEEGETCPKCHNTGVVGDGAPGSVDACPACSGTGAAPSAEEKS